MRYLLSNRQRKELHRGTDLLIALPWTDDIPDEPPLHFARRVLAGADVDHRWIVAAAEEEIVVDILYRGQRTAAGPGDTYAGLPGRGGSYAGLTPYLGKILVPPPPWPQGGLPITIVVVLATLRFGGGRGCLGPQWPGSVILPNGVHLGASQ